jgi:hypothetical protein
MRLLKERYYYVTWKADGTRYMLLILREGAYLIDRNFVFRRVQVRFPVAVSFGIHYRSLCCRGRRIPATVLTCALVTLALFISLDVFGIVISLFGKPCEMRVTKAKMSGMRYSA